MTTVALNGRPHDVAAGTTVAALVGSLTPDAGSCAVAVNDEVVPRHDWGDRRVVEGDRIEVLTAVQGG